MNTYVARCHHCQGNLSRRALNGPWEHTFVIPKIVSAALPTRAELTLPKCRSDKDAVPAKEVKLRHPNGETRSFLLPFKYMLEDRWPDIIMYQDHAFKYVGQEQNGEVGQYEAVTVIAQLNNRDRLQEDIIES